MDIKGYIAPPIVPMEQGPNGIVYDFNDGVRIMFPDGSGEHTVVLLEDGCTSEIVTVRDGGRFNSRKRYYADWSFHILKEDELVFSNIMDLNGKEVLLDIKSDAIGDTIAWFSYAERFQKKHGCVLGVAMNEKLIPLFKDAYPDIAFFNRRQRAALAPYATYHLGVVYADDSSRRAIDYRDVSLDAVAGYVLGIDDKRQIAPRSAVIAVKPCDKYACVSMSASMHQKEWNNPYGWDDVVKYLQKKGYDVICIDKKADDLHFATDDTGNKSLTERLAVLKGASLFVGLPSGLSWLAWMAGVPIVMISGFSKPWAEMPCHRAFNPNVCNGCWNDKRYDFEICDCWCPAGNDCECTREISSQMVIEKIEEALND